METTPMAAFSFILVFCLPFFTRAAEITSAGRTEMNGIRFDAHKDFETKWKLVTVRFRTDTGEQRFTYANEKAWTALRSGTNAYPDGAIFAKAGFGTEDDPLFPSSKVPSGTRRFQFMVRNKKKYAQTDGWGYAIFNSEGQTFGEDPEKVTQACFACHKIATERGEVFSQPMTLGVKPSPMPALAVLSLTYAEKPVGDLPEAIRNLLSPSVKTVRFLSGSLRENVFQGTLDEIRPSLVQEARAKHQPALLLSAKGTSFSLVAPANLSRAKSSMSCSAGQAAFAAWMTIPPPSPDLLPMIKDLVFCAPEK